MSDYDFGPALKAAAIGLATATFFAGLLVGWLAWA